MWREGVAKKCEGHAAASEKKEVQRAQLLLRKKKERTERSAHSTQESASK